jgi:hypothetical protein
LLGEATSGSHGIEPLLAGEGAAGVGGVQNASTTGRPAHDPALGTLVREAPRRAASRRHDVHLGWAFFSADEGDLGAVWREVGPPGLAQASGQPRGATAARSDRPEVIFADEDDGVLVDSGETEVPLVGEQPV